MIADVYEVLYAKMSNRHFTYKKMTSYPLDGCREAERESRTEGT